MTTVQICDGCGEQPSGGPVVSGARSNGLQGGSPLPNGDFDWCTNCALVAFASVRATVDAGVAGGMTPADAVFRAAYAVRPTTAQAPPGHALAGQVPA